MKYIYIVLFFILSASAFAQKTEHQIVISDLAPLSDKDKGIVPTKMLCDPASMLEIVSCAGEDRDASPPTGDNNPANGAFMTWVAQGSSTGLYYSQIIQGTFSTQIVMGGTSISVFPEDPDGTMDINLAIGGNSTNACLDPGTWIVRVWEVLDDNNDGAPDRDGNGDIIGCFQECTFTFLPSCPGGTPFSADVTDVGCVGGGSISLVNFNPNDIYCDGQATYSWTGPGGFTSTSQNISGLAEGEYTFVLNDFYGCETDPLVVVIGPAEPVAITCGNPQAPSVFMASDGSFDVDITAGTGTYTIAYAGPVSGDRPGSDGINTISGIPAGTYNVTVTDDDTGCTADCIIIVEDPPCEVAFTVELDNIGSIVITMTGGRPDYYVSFTGTTTASQDDLGPYIGPTITLSANLFEAGDYIFYVYENDRPDCTNFVEFTIPGPDCTNFAITEDNVSQPTCGQDNGSITVSLSGGNGSMTITWISGPGINNANENDLALTNLPGGTYAYQAFDDEGCVLEGDIDLIISTPLVFNCSAVDESCPEANDGMIAIDVSGGNSPYSISYNALDPDGNFMTNVTDLAVVDGDSLRNLPPGDYFITLSDASGCTAECNTVVEEAICPAFPGDDQGITLDSIINATTIGGTGGIIVSLTGTPDWEYRVVSTTGGQDTTKITSLSPDTLLGLEIDTYQLFLLIPLDTAMLGGNSVCCIPQGGAGPFTFVIAGPECEMTVAVDGMPVNCFGDTDGSILIQTENANGTPVISWDDLALNGFNPTGLPAGNYTGTVTDDSGCIIPFDAVVVQPPLIDAFILEAQPISCGGETDGALLVDAFGGVGNFDFFWNFPGAPNAPFLDNLPAGIYTVDVVDELGCVASAIFELTEPAILDLSCGATAESNIGTSDGKVHFELNGGNAPYSFLLNGAPVARPALDTFRNLSPGEYDIEILDNNGCSASCTAVVNPGGCGDFTISFVTEQPDCDNPNGSSLVVPAGNNGMVTFAWSHSPMSALVDNLAPGDYSVTATDQFNCTAISSLTIEPYEDFPTLTLGEFATTCANACAEVNFSVSGPSPVRIFYTVDQAGTQVQGFVDGSGGAEILSLCPADFGFAEWTTATVSVDSIVAANNCVRLSGESRIIPLFDPSLNTINPVVCANDTFFLGNQTFQADRMTGDVVLGGQSINGCDSIVTVNLSFFPEATNIITPVICASDTFFLGNQTFQADRITGDVVLAGQSGNGCDSIVTVNLSFFPEATNIITPVICASDTFFLGGQTFQADRMTGDVVLGGQSINGCDSIVTVNLSFFPEATNIITPVICASDTFFLGGQTFQADRLTGDVVLAGQSGNGCDSIVIVNLSFFPEATNIITPVICASDTFFLGGQTFQADRMAGDVVLGGQSINGCDSIVTVNLSFFPEATNIITPVICASDTFFLGGQTFQADRMAGDVVLAGQSVNGCDSIVTVNLSFFPEAINAVNPQICPGDTFFLADQAFTVGRLSGDVILPGASANGCDSTVLVSLTVLAPASAPVTATICAADTFFVAGEAFTFARPSGDVVLPGAAANGCDSTVNVSLDFFPQITGELDTTICTGTSFVYGGRTFDSAVDDELVALNVPTANGCDSLVSLTVRLRAVPSVSISGDGVTCDDGILNISITYDGPAEASVELSSNPGDIISVVSGTTTIQRPVPAGTIVTIIAAEDGGPCPLTTSGSITVTQTDLAARIDVMSGDEIFAVSCADGSDGQVMAIPEGGTGPYSFDWNTGADEQMVEGLPAGDYSLIVTSGRGCQTGASISLTSPETMVVQVGRREATCVETDPALLIRNIGGGVGPYVYSVNNGESFLTIGELPDTVSAFVGTTTLTIEDSKGCPLVQEFDFAPAPVGTIQVTPRNAFIVRGDSVEITVLTDLDAAGFLLMPGPAELIETVDFFVKPDSTTTYFVTAVDSSGCTASDEVLVVVDQFVPVYAPTAFSPNLDGTNDLFRVYGGGNVESFSDFAIFDRWGNRVYDLAGPVSPDDENWGWDGRASDGRLRQSAAYVFSIMVTFTDGTTQVVKGDLVLAR